MAGSVQISNFVNFFELVAFLNSLGSFQNVLANLNLFYKCLYEICCYFGSLEICGSLDVYIIDKWK